MRPITKIIKDVQDRAADELRFLDEHSNVGDSPIERTLFTAIFARMTYPTGGLELRFSMQDEVAARLISCVYVTSQAPVGKYRADFVFEVFDGRDWAKLVVECDGHDFHERTKEQAARDKSRDREMTMLAYTVFRFTGSEIYRKPVECAKQITDWLYKNWESRA